jgi:hypothetical protein
VKRLETYDLYVLSSNFPTEFVDMKRTDRRESVWGLVGNMGDSQLGSETHQRTFISPYGVMEDDM